VFSLIFSQLLDAVGYHIAPASRALARLEPCPDKKTTTVEAAATVFHRAQIAQ
jgi:hypothetical protein